MKDGGPAFPQPLIETRDGSLEHPVDENCGMSLRDYFAAHTPFNGGFLKSVNDVVMEKAPQTGERYGDAFCRLLAEHAYRYADAMLRAREKGAPE